MASSSATSGVPSFLTQTNALIRKNLIVQKRTRRETIQLVAFPILLCILLTVLQRIINSTLSDPKYLCGCQCVSNGTGPCQTECGLQFSTSLQAGSCGINHPAQWPPLFQVPQSQYRAVQGSSTSDLPNASCRATNSCPTTVLFTGGNQSLSNTLMRELFPNPLNLNLASGLSNYLIFASEELLGTDIPPGTTEFVDPAFVSSEPLYILDPACLLPGSLSINVTYPGTTVQHEIDIQCVKTMSLWRNSLSQLNGDLYNGYRQSNDQQAINGYTAAFDFQDTDETHYNSIVMYNSTYQNVSVFTSATAILRIPRLVNAAANAYLRFLGGAGTRMLLSFVEEMPKLPSKPSFDFSSLIGPLFFMWVVELLFPVIITKLVYEKQNKLRIMMKMHGLGHSPYYIISYFYFLLLSILYILLFVFFGSIVGLNYFRLNDYGIQFVFFLMFINLQIVFSFLVAAFFSNVNTAQAIGYIYVFGSGFLSAFMFRSFIETKAIPEVWINVLEIIPAFSLFRGLYEFSQYAYEGTQLGTPGMRWQNLNDSVNGMKYALIIMAAEWLVFLPITYYLDQYAARGHHSSIFSFIRRLGKLKQSVHQNDEKILHPDMEDQDIAHNGAENPDIVKEQQVAMQLLSERNNDYAIVCNSLKKVYPGSDGNPDKLAVKGISLALPYGTCFGVLGPNGAGKSTFINMMIGLISPTSGNAIVRGFDIQRDMDRIYNSMGVCPQNDMLWEMLTGREHLMFYGRLKNLKDSELVLAVEESLRSVNLLHGAADKQVKTYSGGMKRRLSVAISLIGYAQVVYMDEPSTGLDPSSRKNLWSAVKQAKRNRAIILTTHSMEEAEVLCDRLCIIVNGSLQCIGSPKELIARYGGTYIFTMTVDSRYDQDVERMVQRLAPSARKIYQLSGTQKFELSKQEVRIADVFHAVDDLKRRVDVQAWGLADTTMEDVFVRVAKDTMPVDAEHS